MEIFKRIEAFFFGIVTMFLAAIFWLMMIIGVMGIGHDGPHFKWPWQSWDDGE